MNGKDDSVREMRPTKDQLREFSRNPSVRELVAEEAADWFVANREGLDSTQRTAFATWLRTSPQHIEEYLTIASIGRDLRVATDDPAVSFEELMKRAAETQDPVAIAEPPAPPRSPPVGSRLVEGPRWHLHLWPSTAAAVAAVAVATLAVLFWKSGAPTRTAEDATVYNIETRHGEQLTRQLPDSSVLKLDTDTSVSVRFDRTQRVVRLIRGRAEFKVAHEPARKFLVQAGTVGITDVGTEFDVYARPDSTVITVLEGRVAVALEPKAASSSGAREDSTTLSPYAPIELVAGQQVRVDNGSWPPTFTPVDVQRATAWLRRQIAFENEPLGRVAAEFNRYAATPIEIDSPALRTLPVSGVFPADDTESFLAFLRSMAGVQVEVTPTRTRVFRK
jgi:transmembrane sensor